MLFTTNKPPLTAWGDVLHDHDLAEAIVDRVLENGRLLLLDGPSYRTRQPARNFRKISRQNFQNPHQVPPGVLSRFGRQVTSALPDSVVERTVLRQSR